ncbi:hypothetical protein BDV39DRAFT_201081 [Aspergillus sergii]|uniref:AttH domain-containing protein n=1 Tax=Aspergillus sergii TaxID=1034303 RepID=A0A5N6XIQ9_9EURO|nr:hypothetical protein BDV39DRAFT_201081 [Aspergillus sergii]
MRFLLPFTLALGLLAQPRAAQTTGEEVFSMGVGPVELVHEGPLVPDNYTNPLFTDTGFVIRGNTTSGEEFHLWIFWYRQIGTHEFIVNSDVMQVSLLRGSFSEGNRTRMNDVPFVNKGQNLEDYRELGTMEVTYDDNLVTWKFENITLQFKSNHWNVKGSYAGVALDLQLEIRGKEFYHAGDFADLEGCDSETTATNYNCSGIAGGINHVYASGTINDNGTALVIDQAQGVHERIIQAKDVPSRLDIGLGRGSLWLHGWGEKFSWFTFTSDEGPYAVGMLNIGNGTHVTSGSLNVTIEERGHWLDSKTNVVNPSAWCTTAVLDTGVLEANVQAFGRVYYYWLRTGGLMIVNQMTADMTMTYTPYDGEPVMDKGRAFMEVMKTFYQQPLLVD